LFLESLEARCLLSYTITDLGTLGGPSSHASGLSPSGLVTGDALTAEGARHAFLWDPAGGMRDLGTLGGDRSFGFAVNDAGQVAGYSDTTNDPLSFHAFLYDGLALNDLGTFGGPTSAAYGINGSGQVVGYADNIAPRNRAFFYDGVTLYPLGTLGGRYSRARAITDAGLVAGDSGVRPAANVPHHAFLWDPVRGLRDIGSLGGDLLNTYGINAGGQVVGDAQNAGSAVYHAFLYDGVMMLDLGTLGGDSSHAYGINDVGLLVGSADTAGGRQHAFLYDGTLNDLNDLIPPDSGWTLVGARGINDAGQIVADGVSPDGAHALLLTPDGGGGGAGPAHRPGPGRKDFSGELLARAGHDAPGASGAVPRAGDERAAPVTPRRVQESQVGRMPTPESRRAPRPGGAGQGSKDLLFTTINSEIQRSELAEPFDVSR
jgi:probable HAF family extracellular repeat protein